jgi:ubiquinone/menaquinone biosynthesis C-methylase UbiE
MDKREQEITIQAFTELAPTYEETVDRELRQFWGVGYQEFIDHLIDKVNVSQNDVVLDVATGKAIVPSKLAGHDDNHSHIIGLDITFAMLVQAKQNLDTDQVPTKVGLVCGSAMEMPFVCDLFDVVICGLGMHHMKATEMLTEMKRVLKPGGRLLMADVGASAFWRSFIGRIVLQILLYHYGLTQKGARAEAEKEAFDNIYTTDEWRSLLTDFGFSGIEIVKFAAKYPWYPSGLIIKAIGA